MSFLWNLIAQLFYFVLAVAVLGFATAVISRLFYRLLGQSRAACYATGLIGTPIHELSHAILCVLFGHRIVEMRLFQIDEQSGTLGYVNHSYNPRNLYQRLGNYFIGVAPLIGGSLVLFLAMSWLMPQTAGEIGEYLTEFAQVQSDIGVSGDSFLAVLAAMGSIVGYLFDGFSFTPACLLFFLLALCISLHMSLSGADIRGALPALPLLVLLLALFNLGFGFLCQVAGLGLYAEAVSFLNRGGSFLLGMLLLSLVLSVGCLLLAVLLRGGVAGLRRLLHR